MTFEMVLTVPLQANDSHQMSNGEQLQMASTSPDQLPTPVTFNQRMQFTSPILHVTDYV